MRKTTAILLLFLLAIPAVGAISVARTYNWNGKTYAVCRLDGGGTVEIKGELGMKDPAAIVKAQAIADSLALPKPDQRSPLSEYTSAEKLATISNAVLKAEYIRRGLGQVEP